MWVFCNGLHRTGSRISFFFFLTCTIIMYISSWALTQLGSTQRWQWEEEMGSSSKGNSMRCAVQAVIVSWYEMGDPFSRAGFPAWFWHLLLPTCLSFPERTFMPSGIACRRPDHVQWYKEKTIGHTIWLHHPWLSVACSVQLVVHLSIIQQDTGKAVAQPSLIWWNTLCHSVVAWHLTSQFFDFFFYNLLRYFCSLYVWTCHWTVHWETHFAVLIIN